MRFQQWIKDQDVVILDGSMSRLLEERGLEINHRLWTALALIDWYDENHEKYGITID